MKSKIDVKFLMFNYKFFPIICPFLFSFLFLFAASLLFAQENQESAIAPLSSKSDFASFPEISPLMMFGRIREKKPAENRTFSPEGKTAENRRAADGSQNLEHTVRENRQTDEIDTTEEGVKAKKEQAARIFSIMQEEANRLTSLVTIPTEKALNLRQQFDETSIYWTKERERYSNLAVILSQDRKTRITSNSLYEIVDHCDDILTVAESLQKSLHDIEASSKNQNAFRSFPKTVSVDEPLQKSLENEIQQTIQKITIIDVATQPLEKKEIPVSEFENDWKSHPHHPSYVEHDKTFPINSDSSELRRDEVNARVAKGFKNSLSLTSEDESEIAELAHARTFEREATKTHLDAKLIKKDEANVNFQSKNFDNLKNSYTAAITSWNKTKLAYQEAVNKFKQIEKKKFLDPAIFEELKEKIQQIEFKISFWNAQHLRIINRRADLEAPTLSSAYKEEATDRELAWNQVLEAFRKLTLQAILAECREDLEVLQQDLANAEHRKTLWSSQLSELNKREELKKLFEEQLKEYQEQKEAIWPEMQQINTPAEQAFYQAKTINNISSWNQAATAAKKAAEDWEQVAVQQRSHSQNNDIAELVVQKENWEQKAILAQIRTTYLENPKSNFYSTSALIRKKTLSPIITAINKILRPGNVNETNITAVRKAALTFPYAEGCFYAYLNNFNPNNHKLYGTGVYCYGGPSIISAVTSVFCSPFASIPTLSAAIFSFYHEISNNYTSSELCHRVASAVSVSLLISTSSLSSDCSDCAKRAREIHDDLRVFFEKEKNNAAYFTGRHNKILIDKKNNFKNAVALTEKIAAYCETVASYNAAKERKNPPPWRGAEQEALTAFENANRLNSEATWNGALRKAIEMISMWNRLIVEKNAGTSSSLLASQCSLQAMATQKDRWEQKAMLAELSANKQSSNFKGKHTDENYKTVIWNLITKKGWPVIRRSMQSFIDHPSEITGIQNTHPLEVQSAINNLDLLIKDVHIATSTWEKHCSHSDHALNVANTTAIYLRAVAAFIASRDSTELAAAEHRPALIVSPYSQEKEPLTEENKGLQKSGEKGCTIF